MTDRSGRRLLLVVAALVGLATAAHVVHDGLEAQQRDACAVCQVAHAPAVGATVETPPPEAPHVLATPVEASLDRDPRPHLLTQAPSRAPPA